MDKQLDGQIGWHIISIIWLNPLEFLFEPPLTYSKKHPKLDIKH